MPRMSGVNINMKETQTALVATTEQAVALPKKPQTLRDIVASDTFKAQAALALPKHCTPDRFARIALTALNRTPKLMQCTKESVLQCLMDLTALGLEPDGRRAHLIPYGDKCTLILDYKGLVELVRRSGEIAYIHADVVCEADEFDYMFGTGAFLKHKPAATARGKVKCAYSFIRLKDGAEDFDVMNVEDVEKVRKKSRSGNSGPWVDHWDEMAKKTVFRRHSKWLPLSAELREKIEKDDEPLSESERMASAKPLAPSSVQIIDPEENQEG